MITQEQLKELFHYCPETGLFTRLITTGARGKKGNIAGSINKKGYVAIIINGKYYRAHRLAWLYIHGRLPSDQIDHISGKRNDNRIGNLREVTPSGNQRNQRVPKNNTSGVIGVTWNKFYGKWTSAITTNHKLKYLGSYDYWFDSVCARKSAENKYDYHRNHGRS